MKFAPRNGTDARTLAYRIPGEVKRPSPPDARVWQNRPAEFSLQPPAVTDAIRPRAIGDRVRPPQSTTVTYRRGQEIFTPGHGEDLVYIVRAGCVRLYKVLPDGRSINLGLLGPNTVFTQEDGAHGFASGATAEALVDTTVSTVEMDDLSTVVAVSPELAGAIVTGMSRRLTELQTLVEHLLVRDSAVRLATTLLSLAERFGRPSADGQIAIALPLTHQSLANMIGSNRVTVTRKLLDLQVRGAIRSLGRNAFAVNPVLLRQIAQPAADAG